MPRAAIRDRDVPAVDPLVAARSAGLRYVRDDAPGIRRVGTATGFRYIDPDGRAIHGTETLARIASLAIPPAWTDVWICPSANGHIQATGRDAKGRKQYRYHPRWRAVRDETKYERMIAFGHALPMIRARTDEHLALPGLPREKVLATVVRLLETTAIRIGNEEYAKANGSFGLTTMRDRHVDISGSTMRFEFRGKAGKKHSIEVHDRRLARVVKRCQDIPGYELFQYVDDEGERRTIDSEDVNAYIREISGQDFTAKDFRTWTGTVLAALALEEDEAVDSDAEAKHNIVQAIESVAKHLGNTPAVCRKCYVHPAVLDAYMEGATLRTLRDQVTRELTDTLRELRPEEAAVMVLLQRRLVRDAARRGGGGT
jgi:DNA topoisomerase-1